MDILGFLTLFACCITLAFSKIEVKEIRGPESIQNGTTDVVVLDCIFDAPKEEPNLVLKWTLNSPSDVIYQWIPPYRPKTKSSESDLYDTHFNVTSDKSTMYRALKISRVDTSMTGNYTCQVSSDVDEDRETKQLIVYVPAKSGLDMAIFADDSAISCSTYGVFPKPEIELFISGNGTYIIDQNETVDVDEDGLFNITKVFTFNNDTIDNSITFTCNMTIPGVTEYSEVKSLNHSIEEEPKPENYESNIIEDYYSTDTVFFSNSSGKKTDSYQENSAVSPYFTPTPCATFLTMLLFFLVK